MAEALAVVGIVANIVQLVDFGSRVLKRLEEYQSKLRDIPEAFRHIKAELPVLLVALQQTKSAIDAGFMQDESRKALLPAIEGCEVQIRLLDDVIAKTLPASSDSWVRRGRKALGSFRYDAKVERITLVVRGYIQTLTFHAAVLRPLADRTLPRPTPCSTLPFRRDLHFVDRQILADIDCKSQQPASRVGLVGLGGVGKSQLAVEYSYRVREKSPITWVFWVHASSTTRFIEGYQKIGERAKLPGLDEPDVDILKLVYNWLCDEANGRWLMIIDNADDLDVFTCQSGRCKGTKDGVASKAAPALMDFLPQSSNGSILITSRSRDVAFRLTGNYADLIKVYPMDQSHALSLLRNKLEGSYEEDDAAALVEALDYMPLAISQAAAYISQRAPRITVSSYLQDLRKSDRNRAKLLDVDIGDPRRDGTASNSIIATWQISFEHIRRERPSATQLLSLMSLFDRQGIPEFLLSGRYQENNDASYDFEDDLNMLTSFSLVAIDVDGHQFKMHRLVQFSTRKWLELQGELDNWMEKYITLIDDSYPEGQYEEWKECQALFPHALVAEAYRPSNGGALKAWASVLSKAAWYASETGNYHAAKDMSQGALEARQATLGVEHPETLASVNNLGLVLEGQGKYKEAEAMHRRALETREKLLGLEHPDTLTSVDNVGLVLERQGKYKDAEVMHQRALEGYKKVLGVEHPSTLTTVNNLGWVLGRQAKYEAAGAMHQQALETREKVLGPEHPDTLTSIDNLGLVLRRRGNYEAAEAMHRRALEIREKVLGIEHPSTLTSVHNFGLVLEKRGDFKAAEAMHRRVLEGYERVLMPEHPCTLKSVNNLGLVLERQGKYKEAEAMHRRALEAREKVLGPEHPDTLTSMANLALTVWRQRWWMMGTGKRVLGHEHPDTLTTMGNLAFTLKSQSRQKEAISLMETCFQLRKRILSRHHPDTESSLEFLNEWRMEDMEIEL